MTYDGTVTRGTATYSSANAKFGSAGVSGAVFNVDGVDTFLSTTPGTTGGSYNTGTIEGWVKSAAPGSVKVLVGHDGWYWLGVDASGNATARFGNGSASPSVEVALSSTAPIADGNFHHVALVFQAGAGVSLYVDGTRAATSTATPTLSSNTASRIGGLVTAGFDWTTAAIDEVRFSSSARYTGTTYTVPAAALVPDAATSAVYHFDGDATGAGYSAVTITPNDTNVIYSPYTWDVTASRAKTINAGAYLRMLINGSPTAITLAFDVAGIAAPLPQVVVSVDDRVVATVPVAATVSVPLPTGATWSKRLLTVVVKSMTETQPRWSPQSTAVSFLGVATSPTNVTTDPLVSRKLRVLVYGDSITEGVRTLNATATNDTDRNDSTLGWAYRLGEKTGSEVGVVGFGGTGISKASGSGGVPSLRNTVGLLWGSGPARSFADTPDAIVIMMGTNDGTVDTTADMTAALNTLIGATPASTKILVLRPFNGNAQAGYLQAAIAACSAPNRVTYVDTNGWWNSADSSDGLHPYGYTNVARLSGLAATAVRNQLGKSSTFINVGGVAKPTAPVRL